MNAFWQNFIFPVDIKRSVGYKEALIIESSISKTVIRLINNFIIDGNFAFVFRNFIRREVSVFLLAFNVNIISSSKIKPKVSNT